MTGEVVVRYDGGVQGKNAGFWLLAGQLLGGDKEPGEFEPWVWVYVVLQKHKGSVQALKIFL